MSYLLALLITKSFFGGGKSSTKATIRSVTPKSSMTSNNLCQKLQIAFSLVSYPETRGKLLEALKFQKSEVWLNNSGITESRTNKSGLKIEVYLLGY